LNETWVVNSSPVITLAKVGQLRLLEQLPAELFVPEAVATELLAGPPGDPARQAIESGWGKRLAADTTLSELLEWGLGPGETEVIAIARNQVAAVAVLDDALARNCAKSLGVSVVGTLGIVLRAKKRGLVHRAGDVLQALRQQGLHLDDLTIRLALGRIGENWPPRDP
jgi:predicted nucleic acid-binding protein